jgi:hypothetical protein
MSPEDQNVSDKERRMTDTWRKSRERVHVGR